MRTNIIKKYSIKNENGDYQVPEDKIDIANAELEEVLNIEENNVFLQKIKISDIQESLPMNIINDLMPILEE